MNALLNNPYVGLSTRKYLLGLIDTGFLDVPCYNILKDIFEHIQPISPCGLFYQIGLAMGVDEEPALAAASLVEMFYAQVSLTDDEQDGDSYLSYPAPIRLNALAQLICLVPTRINSLRPYISDTNALNLAMMAGLVGSGMLMGQRLELTRENWDFAAYCRVARLSAGDQLKFYFTVMAVVADQDPEPYSGIARPLGYIIQLMHDEASQDSRLVGIDPTQLEDHRKQCIEAIVTAEVPEEVLSIIKGVIHGSNG
jgi:hypothetical protein